VIGYMALLQGVLAQALAALRAVCRDSGLTLPELALKWAVANRDVACTLVGSRSVSKLEANVRAVEHAPPAEMIGRFNAITDPLKERLAEASTTTRAGQRSRALTGDSPSTDAFASKFRNEQLAGLTGPRAEVSTASVRAV
jgi:aldo/keto reductase family protein